MSGATRATADVGADVAIATSSWLQGYDTSAGHPVATLSLSYDLANGAYLGASGSAFAGDGGVHLHQLVAYAGYAKPISRGLTLDVGAAHTHFSRLATAWPDSGYTEVYAALSGKLVSGRLSFSPDYFQRGSWILYSELNGSVPLGSGFALNGHGGLLSPLRSGADAERTEYDWRAGVSRSFRRLSIRADWIGGGPGNDFYRGRSHRRSALVLGLTYAL